ncbi:MAG: PaaI family thioesterase [Desulfuromonadales bacterium]|nr:PaaI family thioesterase [Desulfuromonadales bacterium]
MQLFVEPEELRRQGVRQFGLDAWIDSAPFEELVGLTIEEAGGGRAVLTLPFRVKLANGGGVMHGGAMVTLADTAVAMAIKSLLPEGTIFATTDLRMEFIAPVLEGVVTARAEVEGPDGRVFLGRAELAGADGQLFARFSSTFRVARRQSRGDG